MARSNAVSVSYARWSGQPCPLAALAHTHWERADRAAFAEAWEQELAEIPTFTDSDLHIVTGLLLPIWKRLPDESMRVYRLQTDAGERVIGRLGLAGLGSAGRQRRRRDHRAGGCLVGRSRRSHDPRTAGRAAAFAAPR